MRLLFALSLCAGPALAEAPSLALPLDCDLGETCFIQNYMDRDPGPEASDFTCGPLTYDGHKGTDIALLSLAHMQSGVSVRAAAPGRVIGTRDGMADISFTAENAPDITDRDCGNGVLIDHGDEYQTQYCHMKRGSISVEKGQTVSTGSLLGQVGLSGKTQFPHLHLSVRQNGEPLDPFRPADQSTCTTDTTNTLWQDPLGYTAGGLIASGFAPGLPTYEAIKAGTAASETIAPDAEAMVIWGYMFGGRTGDVLQFEFSGPGGLTFSQSITLEKTQAQLYRATGKKRRGAWSTGPVTGTVRLIRDGVEIDQQTATTNLR